MPAMDLLEKGLGKRLLITGVNPASKRAMKTLLHGGELFDCCVDLGFAALNTHGNAEEAASWVQRHHYSSLIIVTADYHMPRSMVEFGAEMPGVKLIPIPFRMRSTNSISRRHEGSAGNISNTSPARRGRL